MDRYQKIVAEAYEEGEFDGLEESGDGLFDFLIHVSRDVRLRHRRER